MFIYVCIDLVVTIVCVSGSLIVAIQLPMLECSAPAPPLLTILLELVLWKRSYGPWDHFIYPVKLCCIRFCLMFSQIQLFENT